MTKRGEQAFCSLSFSLFQSTTGENNDLTGKIESFDLSTMPGLQAFSVYGNAFHGGLPTGLTQHQELIVFDVQRNTYLTGPLGDTTTANITGLSYLRVFLVSYNQLSGDIPPWLWRLPSLQALDLSNNQFTGRLPHTLTHLSYFKFKHPLNNTQTTLDEDVPLILKNNLVVLEYISSTRIYFDVSMNNLEGEIPASFGELRALTGVNLSHNRIKGTIPVGIFGQILELEVLDLSYNQLHGVIPIDLASLDSLDTLNLSSNHLQGVIPKQHNFNTRFGSSSFSDNPGLCGYPLPKCNPNISGVDEHPQANTISNKLSPQFNEVRIWLNEFVSPWGFLIGYVISLALSIFLLYHATSLESYPSPNYK